MSAVVCAAIAGVVLVGCAGKAAGSAPDGQAAMARQDYSAAVVYFKDALQKHPGDQVSRVALGRALLKAGDAAGAAVELGKAQADGAPADEVSPVLAQAILEANDLKKLVNSFAGTKLNAPIAQAELQLTLSEAWQRLGDPEKAAAAAKAAVAAAPDAPTVLLHLAQEQLQRGNLSAARQHVDALLSRESANAQAWLMKGRLQSVDPAAKVEALASLRKAIELDQVNITAHFALINVLLQFGDLAQAKTALQALQARLPRNPWTAFAASQVSYAEGQYGRARELALKLLQVAPDDAAVLALTAWTSLQANELIQAETQFTKALQIKPAAHAARLGLARVELRLGQPAKAMAALKPLLSSPEAEPSALGLAGEAELALNDPAAAEGFFQQSLRVKPDDPATRTALAVTRLTQGDPNAGFAELANIAAASQSLVAEQAAFSARLRRGEFDAALGIVEAMARKQPDHPQIQEWKARVFMARRDYPEARKALQAQWAQDPKAYGALMNLAAIDLLEKQPQAAEARLRSAVKSDPGNAIALMALARLRQQADAPLDEVRELLGDAIKAQPRSPEPRLALIDLCLRKRLFKDAMAAADEAVSALPGDMQILDAAGRAQMESGNPERAITTFRKLAGADAVSAQPYTRMADVYRAMGKPEQAEIALRRALEIDPDLLPAQTSLIGLMVQGNRKAEALQLIRRQQADAPLKPGGYSLEAAFHTQQNDVDKAIASLRTGLAKTQAPILALGLHQFLGALKRYDDADRLAGQWQADHPKDFRFLYQVAELDLRRSRYDRANVLLTRLAEALPDDALVLNNLAATRLQLQLPGATTLAQKAAALMPQNAHVLDTLASAFAADTQFDKALLTQKQAVELTPEATALRLRLARYAAQAGDRQLARQELLRLQALGPGFGQQPEVARLLQQL